MRITRLRLRDFKRHADLDLRLSPGLTVVRGPNEAGKTTIQQALELGLFRRVTSNAQDMADLRRWGTDGGDPTIDLEFEQDSGTGHLRKVFAGAKGTVALDFEGSTLTDPAAVDARLVELTGLASEKFFQSTASIHHHELDDLDKDEGALRDRLQQSMSGADRGTWAARRKLDEAIRKYRSEGARNPGALKSTRDRIATLENDAAAGETALAGLERDRQALSVARAARAAVDVQLAEERRLLAASERAVEVEAKLQETQGRYARFKRAAELQEAIAAKEETHPSRTSLPSLRRAVETVRNMEYGISEIRAELATEPDVTGYDVALKPPTTRPLMILGALLIILGILVAIGGGSLGLVPEIAIAGGVAVVLAGVVSLLLVARRIRQRNDIRRQQMLLDEELTRRLRGRSDRAHELQETERRRDEALTSVDMPDLARAEEVLAAEAAHVAEIEQLQAEYRGLIGDEATGADITKVRDQLAAEADEMRHALAGMGEIGEAPLRSKQRYDTAVRESQSQREHAVDEESRAVARVDQNTVDAEEVAGTAEALEATRADLTIIERRVRIYQQTLEALDAAEQATMKKAARFLEERMGGDVSLITGGRYRRIQVDESELTFKVWAPERNDWVDVRQLSQGTIDQFYLAARLALVRQITQLRNPPLVFDDPFISFDDTRAREALRLMKAMAADHQVIYLTCSSRYDPVADRVVELPGPTSRDPAPVVAPVAAAGPRAGGASASRPSEAFGSRRSAAAAVPGQMPLLAEEPLLRAAPTEASAAGGHPSGEPMTRPAAATGADASAATGAHGSAETGADASAATGADASAATGADGSAATGAHGSAETGADASAETGADGSAETGADGSAETGADGSAESAPDQAGAEVSAAPGADASAESAADQAGADGSAAPGADASAESAADEAGADGSADPATDRSGTDGSAKTGADPSAESATDAAATREDV